MRLAMWSGPRNLSTAMMRAWGSRADTFVTDEPLYGHYLAATGRDHPGRDAVIAAQGTDWRAITAWLTGPIPEGRAIWFQKHMTLHMVAAVGRDWLARIEHAFLIRDPGEVLRSYARVVADPRPEDLGFSQQRALWEDVLQRTGKQAPIVDARDVRSAPAATLQALCAALGVSWDPAMLRWAPGLRPTDGVWAPHWYSDVIASTGFSPWTPPRGELPARLEPVLAACRDDWRFLKERALQIDGAQRMS